MSSREWEEWTLEDHEIAIGNTASRKGPYTHNMLSIHLSYIARRFGYEMANQIVRQHKLKERHGIPEVVTG